MFVSKNNSGVGLHWSHCMFVIQSKQPGHKSHFLGNLTSMVALYVCDKLKRNKSQELLAWELDWLR